MSSYLEDAIEESLRTHGYEDEGELEDLKRQVETLQMALARVTARLVEKNFITQSEFRGPEYPKEKHFAMVRHSGA